MPKHEQEKKIGTNSKEGEKSKNKTKLIRCGGDHKTQHIIDKSSSYDLRIPICYFLQPRL